MNFGVYSSLWQGAAFFLSCIAVVASLRATRIRYWIAFSAYALIVLGHAYIALFPIFFGNQMAKAFHAGSVSAIQTLVPWLALAFFALPVFVLLPVIPQTIARRTAAILFGGAIVVAIISTTYVLLSNPQRFYGPPYGQLGVLLLLLWLRIDDIRGKIT